MKMTDRELRRYNAQLQALKRQQDAADRKAGQALSGGVRSSPADTRGRFIRGRSR